MNQCQTSKLRFLELQQSNRINSSMSHRDFQHHLPPAPLQWTSHLQIDRCIESYMLISKYFSQNLLNFLSNIVANKVVFVTTKSVGNSCHKKEFFTIVMLASSCSFASIIQSTRCCFVGGLIFPLLSFIASDCCSMYWSQHFLR